MSAKKTGATVKQKKSSLHSKLADKEKAFVLFYATWCPFSQRFLPVFSEYSQANPQECLSVIVDEEPEVLEEFEIEYYPTVILFEKGKMCKRLDAEPGVGLNKKQLKSFTDKK
jgi:thiol-disulfide isomerase/thioredoxin